jgi:ParB-like chromosome segregation protein Spo0J
MARTKKLQSEQSAPPEEASLTSHQRFEIARVHRQAIQNAPYNPRTLSKEAAHLLRESLKRNGLVEPPVWNKRTGNLVGGHQRLGQIDALEGTDDYLIDVACVDVDHQQEVALNIALNNRNIQGDWDEEALAELLQTVEPEHYAAIGLTQDDINYYIGEDTAATQAVLDDLSNTPEREEVKDKLDEIKADRAAMNQRLKGENQLDFFLVLIFEDDIEKSDFCERFGFHVADTYIRGIDLQRRVDGG